MEMGHPPIEIVITLATSLLSTIISAVIGYIVYKMQRHSEKIEKQNAEKKAAQEKEARKQEADYKALKDGLQSLLRDKLISLMQQAEKTGYTEVLTLENVETMYAAYHNLGGNGFLTTLYKRFKELPYTHEGE